MHPRALCDQRWRLAWINLTFTPFCHKFIRFEPGTEPQLNLGGSYGVVVSTLDFESSDQGSNPCRT